MICNSLLEWGLGILAKVRLCLLHWLKVWLGSTRVGTSLVTEKTRG